MMTMKTTSILLALAMGVACLSGLNASAIETSKNPQIAKILKSTPPAELPAKAGQLVKSAKAQDRESTTIAVVKAAVELSPTAAHLVVGAIAKAVPDMAPVAAATAAALQPAKQASLITRSAVAAAPTQAGAVVEAVCREVPSEYASIARAAAQVAPASGKEIITAVGLALPALKPTIDQALTVYGGSAPSTAVVMDRVTQIASPMVVMREPVTPTTLPPRPPTIGPPYQPLTQTPTNVPPNTIIEVPPGGRDYSPP
jgi:hypothetical protein